MNEEALRELFSEVWEISNPGKDSLASVNLNQQRLKTFRQVLRITDTQEFYALWALLPQLGFIKNIFSEYVWCTPAFASTMGFENPEDLIGKSDLYLPWSFEMAMHFQEADEAVLFSGLPTRKKESWMLQSTDNQFPHDSIVQLYRYPVFDQKGDVIGVFGAGKVDVLAGHFSRMAKESHALSQLC